MQEEFEQSSQHAAPLEHVPGESPADADGELSALCVYQEKALRRGAYKSRSYCIVGAAACLVGAIQLCVMMVRLARLGGSMRWAMIAGEALLALGALWGCAGLTRRAVAFHRELQKPMLEEPTSPPDFSTLSDGSQQ